MAAISKMRTDSWAMHFTGRRSTSTAAALPPSRRAAAKGTFRGSMSLGVRRGRCGRCGAQATGLGTA